MRTALTLTLLLLLVPVGLARSQELRQGQRVEVDGVWNGDSVTVQDLVKENPDEFPEIKGFASVIDVENRVLVIPPFTIEVPTDCEIDDYHDKGDSYHFAELSKDWRLKIEVEFVEGRRFRALDIGVDRKKAKLDPPIVEIEAVVESVQANRDGSQTIVLLGIPCVIGAQVAVPDAITQRGPPRDGDEDRPSDQLGWGPFTIGGEVQVDFEMRDDFELDSSNQDTFEADTSTLLEALYRVNSKRYFFAKMRSAKAHVIYDENRDLHRVEQTQLEELQVYWGDLFVEGLDLQVGRQDFDDAREWLFDENLDGVRLHWNAKPWQLEYSWSRYLNDAPPGKSNLYNQILMARYFYGRRSFLAAYIVDIQDRSRIDDSPFYVGVRAHSRSDRLLYWFDYAYIDGVGGTREVKAHGLDLGAGYCFVDKPFAPNFYGAFAWGRGDNKSSGKTDRNFRQTGYQDNNDKFFGVASFRYYGEMFRPELSNLKIWTAGVGFSPAPDWSVDILYHRYYQDVAAATIADSRLRATPTGFSTSLGSELDLVVGLDDAFGHLDFELDLGYFMPGGAFGANDHPALWIAAQFEWNF